MPKEVMESHISRPPGKTAASASGACNDCFQAVALKFADLNYFKDPDINQFTGMSCCTRTCCMIIMMSDNPTQCADMRLATFAVAVTPRQAPHPWVPGHSGPLGKP